MLKKAIQNITLQIKLQGLTPYITKYSCNPCIMRLKYLLRATYILQQWLVIIAFTIEQICNKPIS